MLEIIFLCLFSHLFLTVSSFMLFFLFHFLYDYQMENFEEIYNECGSKRIDFANFEAVNPKVPQQDNGYVHDLNG